MLISFLFDFARLAENYDLLDEDDVRLLAEQRGRFANRIVLERVLTACAVVSAFMFFSYGMIAISLAACFIVYGLIPRLLCHSWSSWMDARFRSLMTMSKQREVALFGICSREGFGEGAILRPQRIECLHRLRMLAKLFTECSARLAAVKQTSGPGEQGEQSDQQPPLLCQFVNDELKQLSSMLGEVNDETLDLRSLKALWQYVYLLRSELVRVAIIALSDGGWHRSNLWRVGCTLKCLVMASMLLSPKVTIKVKLGDKRVKEEPMCYGRGAALSAAHTCATQMEWALDKLNEGGGEMPADPTALIRCLQNVISILHSSSSAAARPEVQGDGETDPHGENSHLHANSQDVTYASQEDKEGSYNVDQLERAESDYQIFELETNYYSTNRHMSISGSSEDSTFEMVEDRRGLQSEDRQPLMNELCAVIRKRKEECVEREMEALARLRKVPKEEISREELDRTIGVGGSALNTREAAMNRVAVSAPTFGTMPDAALISAALRARKNQGVAAIVEDQFEGTDQALNSD